MEIFQKEKDAGLSDLLSISMGSIKYDVPVDSTNISLLDKVIASKTEASNTDFDLYPLKSLMVSVGWNKNDDVFLRDIVWGARNTPEDKPLNIHHKDIDIIGHIVGNYVIDNEGNTIDNSTEFKDLPDIFHIVASSVIYKNCWSNNDRADAVKQIIAEIQEDLQKTDKTQAKWFVSMECLFDGFDYAVIDEAGKHSIITRDENSSVLTASLRAYGGNGTYGKYKIGRALKNLSFSALGLVNKPANPVSFIFDGVLSFREESNSQVQEIMETVMANENIDTAKVLIDEYKAKIEAMEKEKAALSVKVSDLEKSNKELNDKVSANENTIKELNGKIETAEGDKSELNKSVETANTKIAELEKSVNDMKSEKIKAERVAKLVDKGLAKEDAEAKVNTFAALSDEQFNAVAELIQAPKPAEKSAEKQGEPAAAAAAASVIDGAKSDNKPALAADANAKDEEVEKAKAEMVEFFKTEIVDKRKQKKN